MQRCLLYGGDYRLYCAYVPWFRQCRRLPSTTVKWTLDLVQAVSRNM
jgi:hypothetical protein